MTFRYSIAAAVALVLTAGLVRLTEVETHTSLRFDGNTLFWTVNGNVLSAQTGVLSPQGLQIRAAPSVYRMGLVRLSVKEGSEKVVTSLSATKFRFQHKYAPVVDWRVDDASHEETVLSVGAWAPGPFEVEAVFRGRCSLPTTLVLAGTPVSVQFRSGLIYDHAFIFQQGRPHLMGSASYGPVKGTIYLAGFFLRALCGALILLLFLGLLWEKFPFLFEKSRKVHPLRRSVETALSGFFSKPWVVAIPIAGGFFILAWINYSVLEKLTHIPDSVSYLLFAKWLASGKIAQLQTTLEPFLDVPYTYFHRGNWVSVYPIGWPLLLAPWQWLGAAWLAAPVCGAGYFWALFRLCREFEDTATATLAVLMSVLSPALLLIFSDYMSHAAGSLFVLLSVCLFLAAIRRPGKGLPFAAGCCLGYAFGIRPLTTAAVALGIAGFSAWEWLSLPRARGATSRGMVFLALGVVVGAVPLLIANTLVMGKPWIFPYQLAGADTLSFSTLYSGIPNADSTMAYLFPTLFGWGWSWAGGLSLLPHGIAFGLALVPFLTAKARRVDVFLAVLFCLVVFAYALTPHLGVHGFGARYYSEVFFCVFFLAARGIFILSSWPKPRFPLVAVLVVVFCLGNAWTLRQRLSRFKSYNDVDNSLVEAVSRLPAGKALIVFDTHEWYNWGQSGILLPADLQADKVFATRQKDNKRLLEFYPDRPVYLWSRGSRVLKPIDRKELASGS